MTQFKEGRSSVPALDGATAALVRQSARITSGSEEEIRAGFAECAAAKVSQRWQEELVLQSYLFAGFPRALNAARAVSPALDEWMIVEGYGKVLSRAGLDLGRRELCIIAACAAAGQDRQLHSHLHGALNAGVSAEGVGAALDGIFSHEILSRALLLFARVLGKS